ncbi:MAG: hypothetical protein J6W80_04420, partial [Kiritimatiellae bacterium]|nr:hypothetical protein [Kiritimatiellia bacterium]
MKKGIIMAVAAATALGAQCSIGTAYDATNTVRTVRAPGKAWTMDVSSDVQYRISFFRPDVFRLEAAKFKESGEGANKVKTPDYTDSRNNPGHAQILVDEYREDDSEVSMEETEGEVVYRTSEIAVRFAKPGYRMSVETWRGKKIFEESKPVEFVSTNEGIISNLYTDSTVIDDFARNRGITISYQDLIRSYMRLTDYLEGKVPSIDVEVTINGEKQLMFDYEQETVHMV